MESDDAAPCDWAAGTPNPGSDEAIEMGCRCPVLDNAHGRGYLCEDGIFIVSGDCPVHGG